ncbi:MAG: hypothetical protein WC729_28165 [Sphingomonas sp.]|jgi:hypothetical protein|uniref:CC0125/CC1285 family lipoprotein n=1 Tax=Sphingomonas sp. TaxID=28214 RepID=UPI00356AF38C
MRASWWNPHIAAGGIVGANRGRCCVAVLLLLAAGCSTTGLTYQPETAGGRGGYAEQRLWDGRYRVTFTAPPGTEVASIDAMAHRHAAELALSLGFKGFVVLDRSVTRDIYVLLGPEDARTTYGGDYRAWRRFWRIYCLAEGLQRCDDDPLWPSRQKSKRYMQVAYTIRMTNELDAPAIDARAALGPSGKLTSFGPSIPVDAP